MFVPRYSEGVVTRDWSAELTFQLHALGFSGYEREFRFAVPRRFRFDLAFPEHKLAVEIDGIVYTKGSHMAGGRHTSIKGLRAECEKSALATLHGFRVIHVLPEHVLSGQAIAWIEQALKGARAA